jgi:tetratricopeptide (TPR) repeat protein
MNTDSPNGALENDAEFHPDLAGTGYEGGEAPEQERTEYVEAESDDTPRSTLGFAGDTDVREALGVYRDAARANPKSVRALTDLAEGYAAADLPHRALQQYQKALEVQRDNGGEDLPDAHLGIGDLCRTFALSATAVRSYERAVRLRPNKPYYRWKLAIALAAMGLYEKAELQLRTAVELAPSDTYYRFQLADVYLLMNRDEDAIHELQTVCAQARRDDYYQLRLGAALLRNERAAESITHFARAVELQPENASYHTLLRYAYTRNGQEPPISVDVDMISLGAYDEDFVRRIQRMAQPVG